MSSGNELNSLARFRKQSEKLVLEEHGHCEVPAGCGGVVLRWRDPLAAVPLTLALYSVADDCDCFLDGTRIRGGVVEVAPGRHAFSFVLKNADLSAGGILFAAVQQEAIPGSTAPAQMIVEPPVQVLTADDGSWKISPQNPVAGNPGAGNPGAGNPGAGNPVTAKPAAADWQAADFDDRDWLCLMRQPDPAEDGAYAAMRCLSKGAVCLGLPGSPVAEPTKPAAWWQRLRRRPAASVPRSDVWIRKVFEVPTPQLGAS